MAEETTEESSGRQARVRMAADIVAAYFNNNALPASAVGEAIHSVFQALSGLERTGNGAAAGPLKPAVPIGRSVSPEAIICLEDGRKLKTLKRHLRVAFGMTPQEYRAKWRLPADYPMVAPNYAKQRSKFAKKIGLGRNPAKRPAG